MMIKIDRNRGINNYDDIYEYMNRIINEHMNIII